MDIIACISPINGIGVAVAIDIKNDKDTLKKDQVEFIDEWEQAKGIALTVNRPDEFILWYNKQKWIKKR